MNNMLTFQDACMHIIIMVAGEKKHDRYVYKSNI